MYKLVIADEEGSTSTVPIIRDEITIGRKEGNTIRLTERDVSREHARIVRENERIFVENVNARYGVKKNGVKIKQREEFSPGDVIGIGAYSLTLKSKKSAAKAPPMPAAKPAPALSQDQKTQVIPAMPAKLVVVSSNFAGQEFPLNRQEMIIGRGEDCDIIIDHRSVSQRHAKVIRENGNHYQIVDLNSKNGVTVGGDQYRAVQIKRGDVVELGHVKFRFVAPGENYVFTPQPTSEAGDFEFDAPQKSSSKLPLIALVLVLLIGAGAAFVIFNNKKSVPGDAVAQPGDDLLADSAPALQDSAPASKVGQAIQEASEAIRAGNLDKALGSLESAKKYLDPSPDEQNAIAELMGTANNEKPFKKYYTNAKESLKSSDYTDTLEHLSKIPEHSIFAKLSQDDGLRTSALDGMVASGEEVLAAGDKDKARAFAESALAEDEQYPGALALLEKLDTKPVAVAAKAPASTSTSRNSRPARKSKPKPKPKSVSADEAQALYVSAQGKIFKSDTAGAISDCKQALRGGHSGCYRILAIAYKQQGNNSAACKNFSRFMGTKPNNPDAIQRQMDQIGCN